MYAILDEDVSRQAGWTLVDLATACLDGGARLLQVRAKAAPGGWLLETAAAITERAHAAGAVVVVNDRADIARLSGADGVHVGQDDLDPKAVRTLLGAHAVVGLSTHTQAQMTEAVTEPITYLACGPVFQTGTKATGHEPGGTDMVRRAVAAAAAAVGAAAGDTVGERGALPVVAIGGITIETAADVIDAGAASVAVISDLLATGDPRARVREYLRRLST